MKRVAVVGAGWAGLAAAVRLVQAGQTVSLFEMAAHAGGRARSVAGPDAAASDRLDNGQHILIGAYQATLALMRGVGVDPDQVLRRLPLSLSYPDGSGLRLPAGPAVPAFVRGVLAHSGWTWGERLALLRAAAGWAARRFRCPPDWSVQQLCAALPARVRDDLIDPLCVAALNTPAAQASAQVLLRVLRDALFSGPGAADLLLPRRPLDALLPAPALAWLTQQGAAVHLGRRVQRLSPAGAGWALDGERFDAAVLACSAVEAARLSADIAPDWSASAAALGYEPIATVYLHAPGARLTEPMTALRAAAATAPAQFAFDLGALGGTPGRFAFVVSGAADWVRAGREALLTATLAQARAALQPAGTPVAVHQLLIEKRATFRCTPGLQRPSGCIADGLWAAGDHVAGPYPATLEGAVRSGDAAAAGIVTG